MTVTLREETDGSAVAHVGQLSPEVDVDRAKLPADPVYPGRFLPTYSAPERRFTRYMPERFSCEGVPVAVVEIHVERIELVCSGLSVLDEMKWSPVEPRLGRERIRRRTGTPCTLV
ncbi:hypothetical protein [Streptomyces leeuwenhoekii]|uniref:hypothetical protein n=1 Tax=Streptomyces leeuwenhoekii TaxID=1437453 RepID=UPI000493F955|nr:hypothetical protein [Streptomyces leeuwenhoekii]